jgi:branched-chain amino acid transport system substrate-binding protein
VIKKNRWLQLVAAFCALSLMAAACGDDDDSGSDNNDDGSSQTTEAPSGDALAIGRVLPDTGPLSFLGPPMIEGVKLAIEDINAAGGVLGQDVELLEGDEGDTPQVAAETVSRLLNEGANAIIGGAASGSSQEFIQTLSDAKIPQCSGSNTSPAFTDQENADYYFRTVPPDEAVAPIIADTVIADGNTNVAVVARADDYGKALGDLVEKGITDGGGTVAARVDYNPEADNFTAEVGKITAASPDAVVLISFDEGGDIVRGLLEAGLKASQIYGSDGVFGPTFTEQVDPANPAAIDGMKVIGAAGDEEFNSRIAEPTNSNFIYGGQSYDCVIVIALAAEAAGSVDGDAIIGEITNVTSGGEKCTSFADCKKLLEDGKDIDYDGAAGALELDDVGDPSVGRYAIGQFNGGAIDIVGSQDVKL